MASLRALQHHVRQGRLPVPGHSSLQSSSFQGKRAVGSGHGIHNVAWRDSDLHQTPAHAPRNASAGPRTHTFIYALSLSSACIASIAVCVKAHMASTMCCAGSGSGPSATLRKLGQEWQVFELCSIMCNKGGCRCQDIPPCRARVSKEKEPLAPATAFTTWLGETLTCIKLRHVPLGMRDPTPLVCRSRTSWSAKALNIMWKKYFFPIKFRASHRIESLSP